MAVVEGAVEPAGQGSGGYRAASDSGRFLAVAGEEGEGGDAPWQRLPRAPGRGRRLSLGLLVGVLLGDLALFAVLGRVWLDARAGVPVVLDDTRLLLLLAGSAAVLVGSLWVLLRWFRPLR